MLKNCLGTALGGLLLFSVLLSSTACNADVGADASRNTNAHESSALSTGTLTEDDYAIYSIADTPGAFPDIPYVMKFLHDGQGDDIVTYDEYRYYQLYYKSYYDGGDDNYWVTKPEMRARVEDTIRQTILRDHAVYAECAKYGILLTEEERDALDRANAEMVRGFGSMDVFLEALDVYHMSVWYYDYSTELSELYMKLNDYYLENGYILTSDGDVRALLDTEEYARCKHILIMNDAGDDLTENRALAEDILTRLRAGEDFDTLMNTYSEDTGLETNPDGYYFFYDEMDEAFSNASFALAEGEMSEIVESTYGYHIILRCEKDPAYLDENLASIKELYQLLRYYDLIDNVYTNWETEYAPSYETYADWKFAQSIGDLYTGSTES